MAARIYDLNPVYWDTLALAPCANGTLETYSDEACTTPYATFNSKDLDVANPVVIPLDADGRASVEMWAGVAVFVRLLDEDDNVIWTREFTSGVPAGLTLPALEPLEYLTGDGVGGYAAGVLMPLPDPTGSADYMVVVNADGDGYELQTQPAAVEAPELDIDIDVSTGTGIIIGDGVSATKYRRFFGSATGVNAGGRTQTVSVTFPADTFSGTPWFASFVCTNGASLAVDGNMVMPRLTTLSATGFTVVWECGERDDSQTDYDLNAAVSFNYAVDGPYEAP